MPKYIDSDEDEIRESPISQMIKENPKKKFLTEFWPIQKLRQEGKLEDAEAILMDALPTPAVGDELRKVLYEMALRAKKNDDWPMVLVYLQRYIDYKARNDKAAVKFVNQELPTFSIRQVKLYDEAIRRNSLSK